MFTKFLSVFLLGALFVSPVTPGWFPWWPSSDTSGQNLNWVLDQILTALSGDLIAQHGDEVRIKMSKVDASAEVPFLWTTLSVSAVSNDTGILKNLSTVVRVSDALIKQEAGSNEATAISLQAELQVKQLTMTYEQVDVTMSILSYSGSLEVSCPENAFEIAVDINKGDTCTTTLDQASMKKLSECTVELGSSGILNFIRKWAFTYALREATSDIETSLNAQIPDILTPILKDHDICTYLNPTKAS